MKDMSNEKIAKALYPGCIVKYDNRFGMVLTVGLDLLLADLNKRGEALEVVS